MTASRIAVRRRHQIMGGPVVAGKPSDGVSAAWSTDKSQITVIMPAGQFFAAKLIGGGSMKPAPPLVLTNDCTNQVYTPDAPVPTAATYKIAVAGATAKSSVLIGYTAIGPPSVSLKTYPAPAAPRPVPIAVA